MREGGWKTPTSGHHARSSTAMVKYSHGQIQPLVKYSHGQVQPWSSTAMVKFMLCAWTVY